MSIEETPSEELRELSRKVADSPPLTAGIVRVSVCDGEVFVQVGTFMVFYAKATGELRLDVSSTGKET